MAFSEIKVVKVLIRLAGLDDRKKESTFINDAIRSEFHKKFMDKYGVVPGVYGSALYEEATIYFMALEKVGDPKNHDAIGKAIGVPIPARVEELVAEGALGKKSGRGFYDYS